MQIKKQPKPKLCPCGIKFTPMRSIQKFHSPGCELKFKTGNVPDEMLERLDFDVLFDVAVGAFQEYIKVRDADEKCISCGRDFSHDRRIQPGHYYSKVSHSWLIFDEVNCNGECDFCNCSDPNHLKGYCDGLVKRYGDSKAAELFARAIRPMYFKPAKYELKEIIFKYRGMTEDLKASPHRGK